MTSFELSGFEELQEDLKKAIDLYPDKAEEVLQKQGKEFSKQVRRITLDVTKRYKGNITKGFKVTKVTGYRENMECHFMAEGRGKKNPHFHLVENGHDVYAGGKGGHESQKVGYVPGKHMVQKAAMEYQEKLPLVMEEMRDSILKGADLD